MPLYTVGHSNRSIEDFIALLQSHEITQVIDIRAIPYSGYNPQFNRETIERDLKAVGIGYIHNPILAGEPPDRQTMTKAVRCSDRSRNYASYLEGSRQEEELQRVASLASSPDHTTETIALMCGEKRPDHCHRYITASRLDRMGAEVIHIIDQTRTEPHQPTLF